MRNASRLGGVALLLGALCAPGFAQAPPNLPTADQIKDQVRRVFEASPEATVEIAGIVKITYKRVPTDPQEIAKLLGQNMRNGGQLPPGVGDAEVNAYMRQYEGQLAELLNEFLANLGKIEVKVPLKIRSKKIPVGEWQLSLQMEGERPDMFVIRGEQLPNEGRPIELPLKTRPVDLQKELSVELKEPRRQKEGDEEFEIQVSFLRFQARTKSKIERDAAGGE